MIYLDLNYLILLHCLGTNHIKNIVLYQHLYYWLKLYHLNVWHFYLNVFGEYLNVFGESFFDGASAPVFCVSYDHVLRVLVYFFCSSFHFIL